MPIVKLPRKRLISMTRDTITVDIPKDITKKKKDINMDIIKKAKGMWKHKKVNGVKYQRKIRSEWD